MEIKCSEIWDEPILQLHQKCNVDFSPFRAGSGRELFKYYLQFYFYFFFFLPEIVEIILYLSAVALWDLMKMSSSPASLS